MTTNRTKRLATGWGKPERGPDGAPCCRWCKGPVPKGRRTFCGPGCVHEWRIRSDPGYARRMVFRRDRGICGACGRDCDPRRRRIAEVEAAIGRQAIGDCPDLYRELLALRGDRSSPTTPWEADHIVPVCRGGGECGLENLRTLCRPCHVRVTAELAAERAAERRATRQQGDLFAAKQPKPKQRSLDGEAA